MAAIESRPTPCLPAAAAPEGEIVEATAISIVGQLVGQQLEAAVVQLEPVGALGDDLAPQEPDHDVERLVHAPALVHRVDAHHERVGGQLAGADAEHHPAEALVVELAHAVGQDQRVVVAAAS